MNSSRQTAAGAGWNDDGQPPSYQELLDQRDQPREFSWLRPWPLLASLNQVIDSTLADVVNPRRLDWTNELSDDLLFRGLDEDHGPFSFLLAGDTGEADESEYAIVGPLRAAGAETSFTVIVSDVIYPAGDVNDYVNGFYIPFEDYDKPIYALPGNHDWITGLTGFMFHFCNRDSSPATRHRLPLIRMKGIIPRFWAPTDVLARVLWRREAQPRQAAKDWRARRVQPDPPQPGPYWAMDAGPIRLVAIDTGIDGSIDQEQASWLATVSSGPRPKILLTGKPLYVNHVHKPGRVLTGGDTSLPTTVDAFVTKPEHGYIAAIGGDIHNYQRYRRPQSGTREIQYIVSGGGGAFLSSTHQLGRPEARYGGSGVVTEQSFRCYPLRGDSLLHFQRLAWEGAPRLTLAAVLLATLLIGAALVLGWATGTAESPVLPDSELTRGWDSVEAGVLLAVAAATGLLTILVLGDVWRGIGNVVKLGAVSAALIFLPEGPAVAATFAFAVVHKLVWPRRHMFTSLLIAIAAICAAVWLARDDFTIVYDHWGEGLAILVVLILPFARTPPLFIRLALTAALGAALWLFGQGKVLAGSFALAALLLTLLLLWSTLPFLVGLRALAAVGNPFDADWARAPTPDEATKWLAVRRLEGIDPVRAGARAVQLSEIPLLARMSFWLLCPKRGFARRAQSKFSEIFDSNQPPFFRSFLRVDVDPEAQTVTIRCIGATGRASMDGDAPVEDQVVVAFDGQLISQLA